MHGLEVEGPPPIAESLFVRGFLSEQGRDEGGRGIFEPGARILLALKVENISPLMFLTNTRAFISWDDPLLSPPRSSDRSRTISFPAGEKTIFFVFGRTPTLSEAAEPGTEVEFRVWIRKGDAQPWEQTFSIVVAGRPTAVDEQGALPEDFALLANFPNPFNAETAIAYQLPKNGPVRLAIFNSAGQRIRQLVDDTQGPGSYQVVWDGRDDQGATMATGVYFYRLVAGSSSETRRLLLLK